MKKALPVMLAGLMLAGTAFAGIQAVQMTRSQALEQALTHSGDIMLDELNLELQTLQHENALRNARITPIDTYQGRMTKEVTPYVQETALILREMTNERNRKLLELSMVSLGFDLAAARTDLETSLSAYEKALASQTDALSFGSLTSIEKLNHEAEVLSRRISLDKATNRVRNLEEDQAILLGQENVAFDLPLVCPDPYGIDVDKAVTSARRTDITLFSLERDVRAKEMTYAILKEFQGINHADTLAGLESLERSKLNLSKGIRSLEVAVRNAVDDLKTRHDTLSLNLLNLDIRKENLNIVKRQRASGMVTQTALDAAQSLYDQAQNEYMRNLGAYQKARLAFAIDTGFDF
ncbi:MAG: TolC family protein [Clostridia bacterium]